MHVVIREGHWILLDEISLAAPETLQRICGLLEVTDESHSLTHDLAYLVLLCIDRLLGSSTLLLYATAVLCGGLAVMF